MLRFSGRLLLRPTATETAEYRRICSLYALRLAVVSGVRRTDPADLFASGSMCDRTKHADEWLLSEALGSMYRR